MKRNLIISIALLAFGTLVSYGTNPVILPLRFDRYYSYEEVNEALRLLHETYPNLTRLDRVGKSDEGRDIMALTICNEKTGPEREKPGIYVDGNIHGNEIQAGEVCLYLADYLLGRYGKNDKITPLIDRCAFYILPVVNVDGRWHFFNDANTPSTNRSIRRPQDDDNDGLFDEDGYDDLDGDGNICQMRIKDPDGSYKTDATDKRLMVPIKPEEKGEWTLLGYEGIDNDNDGRFNEDNEGYLDPNRNWPYNWKPEFIQRGAGEYPFSGIGLKAVGAYIEERTNILMVWAFHNNGGMFLRSPSTKEAEVPRQDIETYDLLGLNAEKIVPGYKYMPSYDLYDTYGDFGEFTYNVMGAYTFVGELFQVENEAYNKTGKAPDDESQQDLERLKFNDRLAMGELFKEWKPFQHPVYGEIEIGGWTKMSSRLPHPFMLPDLVHRNASAVLYSATQLPLIEMEIFEKEKIGKDLWKIRVRLRNTKGLPTMTQQSWQKKIHSPDQVLASGAKVIASGKITDRYTNQVEYKEFRPELQFTRVPGFSTVEYEFIVEGKGKLSIEYRSLKANDCSKIIELK
ncbi:MAG TPA: M14 family metallopeptidase [Prolixibacteraceae bacterium]|nr:M14 family metallopeptidase [Prolixibacteraceae bacterium]